MTEVIGVSFRSAGKVYYFSPAGFEVKRGDYVIVETARGVEMGKVAMGPREVEDEAVVQPLRGIMRVASSQDKEKAALTRAKEKTAVAICKGKIAKHGLEMKLIDAEYTFDESKLLFYFTADGRVDFRELVKDLASEFRTRIELRQVGVRDETKILGGIGICGRVLCCHSYLSDFVPVSIKMAKEQNLSLNPTKISGVCGRLMCCLKNEQDTYEELNRHLPGINDIVITKDGMSGKVESVDVLRQKVKIIVEKGDEREMFEIEASQVASRVNRGKKKKAAKYIPDATEEELLALEDNDRSVKSSQGRNDEKKEHRGKGRDGQKDQNRDSRDQGRDGGKDQNRDGGKDQNREPKDQNRDSHRGESRDGGKGEKKERRNRQDRDRRHGNNNKNGKQQDKD